MNSAKNIFFATENTTDDFLLELGAPSCGQCIARDISMCSALKDDELNIVSNLSKNLSVKSKQGICAEGEVANHLFNIKKGSVRMSKMLSDGRRQVIGFLFPGDFFGLSCAKGYSYSAESITEVEICRMPRDKVFRKFDELPALGQKVLDIIRTELDTTQDQMLLLGRKTAKEKLCSFLLAMQKKSCRIENIKKDQAYLPMSRSDIADYLGLTIETVSRQFTILVKEKLISLESSSIVKILNEGRIAIIASGD
mgnify:FL=1